MKSELEKIINDRFDALERMKDVLLVGAFEQPAELPVGVLVDLGKQINDMLKLNQEIRKEDRAKVRRIISDAISAGIAAGRAAALSL
jgi:hypothetical protein